MAADVALQGMDGIELLRRAHALHPGAGRAVFVPMADAPSGPRTSRRAFRIG